MRPPQTPLLDQMLKLEQDYQQVVARYADLRCQRETLKAELEVERAQALVAFLDQGAKVTEAERRLAADVTFLAKEKHLLGLQREEWLVEGYRRLLDHKAMFLVTLGGIARAELEKTALSA